MCLLSTADKVTENLKNVIKKVPPSVVAPMNSIRKALGVSVNTSDGNGATTDFYNNNKQVYRTNRMMFAFTNFLMITNIIQKHGSISQMLHT